MTKLMINVQILFSKYLCYLWHGKIVLPTKRGLTNSPSNNGSWSFRQKPGEKKIHFNLLKQDQLSNQLDERRLNKHMYRKGVQSM